MSQLQFTLAGSLEKVLPNQAPAPLKSNVLSGLWGETLSFQLAYHCKGQGHESNYRFHLKLSSSLPDHIRIRKVELVPVAYPCHAEWDEDYLTTEPGLLPDLLTPLDLDESIKGVPAQWRALWLDIKLDENMTEQEYPVTISVQDLQDTELWSTTLMIRPIPVQLPEQKLLHTEWMHTDCLVDYYKVPAFSEEHWRILDHFIASAADHGVNMLLTPVFTPPLDTAIGGERTTVQLVDIVKNGQRYEFDFSKLEYWLELCRKHGITNIEISHLFSQWGAEFAPKIMAKVNGTEQRIFGWDTPATGEEYKAFLHNFLPKLKAFLKEQGFFEHTWFHISDEPHEHQKATYAAAKAVVQDLLADCKVIDALSSFKLYQEGVVEKPVPCNDHIQPFIDAGVPNLWTYYCTAQQLKVSNRFMSMPSSRNRILGSQLYLYNIEGFLHWGFNFYNNQHSVKPIDPFLVTDAGEAFPSGDPFLVYPAPDGSAYDSIRGMVLKEALYDLRALECLESLKGRAAVEALINEGVQEPITFDQYPKGPDYLISLREKVNREIAACL